jgi:hypothetical protein
MANESTEVQEVPDWSGAKLANGEFLNYTKAIVGALNGLDHTKVPVGEPLAELDATNQRLTDFINESRQYASTSEIARQDARRDAYFKAMWRALEQLEELGEDVPAGASAHLVLSKIGTYKGAYAHSIVKETEELHGLAFDLQKSPEAVQALTQLGMLPWLNGMCAANDEVDRLYASRTDERSEREASKGGDSTASLRKTAAGLVSTIIRRVNVTCEINPSEDATSAANSLIGIIKQYKLVASAHKTTKKDDPEPNAAK